jgi:hypothetical protein
MDITELIDELSEKFVGHTNWEFADPRKTGINPEEIQEHIPSIIIYKDPLKDQEE